MTPTWGTSGRALRSPLRARIAGAGACTAAFEGTSRSSSTIARRDPAPAAADAGSTKRATAKAANPALTPLITQMVGAAQAGRHQFFGQPEPKPKESRKNAER